MKNRNIYLILFSSILIGVLLGCSSIYDFEVTGKIINYDPQKYSDLTIKFDFYQSYKVPETAYSHEINSDGSFRIWGSFSNVYPNGLSFVADDTTLARFHFSEKKEKFVMKNLLTKEKFYAVKEDTIRFANVTVELIEKNDKLLAINFDKLFKGFHIDIEDKELYLFFSQEPRMGTEIKIHALKGLKSIKEAFPVTSDTVTIDIQRYISSSEKLYIDWIELITPYGWSKKYSIYDFKYGSIFRN